ncbi:MAG: hypothetical protein V1802_01700 [Candidatus Aenigmatarchaeota archaeon]
MKGISQIDFVIAAGIFIVAFGFAINSLSNSMALSEKPGSIALLRSRAVNMVDSLLSESGIETEAYMLYVNVSNVKERLINKSITSIIETLRNETVKVNFSLLNISQPDFNSIVVYESGQRLKHNISDTLLRFSTNLNIGQSKIFSVYFDDDSNFTNASGYIRGPNKLNEVVLPVERIHVIQYRKIQGFFEDYNKLKAYYGGDFRIVIYDKKTGAQIIYGYEPPKKGDVISMSRFVMIQNATADINEAEISVIVW